LRLPDHLNCQLRNHCSSGSLTLINSQQRQAGYRLLRSGLEALGPHTLARRLAEGWDRYGAPSAARTPEGGG